MQRYTAINERRMWLRKWTTDSFLRMMPAWLIYICYCAGPALSSSPRHVSNTADKRVNHLNGRAASGGEPLKINNSYAEASGCVRITHIFASGAATASTSIPSSGGIFAATGGEGGHTDEQEEMQGCKREAWEHREQEVNMVKAEGSVELRRGFCVPRCWRWCSLHLREWK